MCTTYHATLSSEETVRQLELLSPDRAKFHPQLFDMLIKFRWHKIGLTADIEKAFLMVGINKTDRGMLRFLWLKDPGTSFTAFNLNNHF